MSTTKNRASPKKPRKKRRTTCLREGCKNPLPEIAIAHGDDFCSTNCARQYFGVKERDKLT